jgi:hypothetical protein
METIARITKLAVQLKRGVITETEFQQEVIEVIVEDRTKILNAERNGTLHTA